MFDVTFGDPPVTLELRCRDAAGHLHLRRFMEGEPLTLPGAELPARWLHDDAGRPYVQKFVPSDARSGARIVLLENEVRVLARLVQLFGDHYPPSLPCLVGFNLSAVEPFVVLEGYLGEPLACAGRLDEKKQRGVQIRLMQALVYTAAAGIVHGTMGLPVLRWDGELVQLVDFERSALSENSWQDIQAAGLAIRELAGVPTPLGVDPADVKDPRTLRKLLRGVFGPVERCPSATDLLSKLGAPGVVSVPGPDPRLAEGQRRFNTACAHKREFGERHKREYRRGRRVWVVAVVLATMVILIVILVGLE